MPKTLIIVSGGDAPGINAFLMFYTQLAAGEVVLGAIGGLPGAVKDQITPLSIAALAPLVGTAGSYLPSSREPILRTAEGRTQLMASLNAHQIDSVVLLGGNGSLAILTPILRDLGLRCIGLPCTIDNDVPGTERTLGFDSACNFAYPAADGIYATAQALLGRIFTIETLGGDSGMLALEIAAGIGADAVLVKEYEYDIAWVGQRLLSVVHRQGYALLVHGEGAKGSRTLAEDIQHQTGIRVRDTRLGHAQRGARPTHLDRLLASQMARIAFYAVRNGIPLGAVVVRNGRVQLHEGTLEGFPAQIPDRSVYEAVNGL